ncbi:MAG TPA: aminomethyltransferase family protein [Actinomycetota bacterium]|nr:aminomethyltransferase family protein [Actinomycetota bacterium]
MADEPIRSVWYDLQAEQGAEFEDFDGWMWTASLGDVAAEYEAIRTDVGMWDVYPLVKWDLSGPDALEAAQRVFTNDLGSIGPGRVRYGAFVNERGDMVDDGTVYRLAEDHCWVMTNTPGYEAWWEEAFEGLDVRFEDRTRRMPLLSVQGPRSRELLQGLTEADLSALRYFSFWPDRVEVAGVPAWVMRTGFSGELGFELIADPEPAVDLWRAIQEAGARIFGTHGVEIARIESGMVVIGVDYEPGARTPYDLSFDRLVKLDAGFLGADALRPVAADPPMRLKTLRIEGSEVPEYGAAVTRDGEEVGTLTSPAESPRFGVIGLAVLESRHAANGTSVEVALGGGTVPATVTGLSVYDPDKLRPRD